MSSHEFEYELNIGPMGVVMANVCFDHQPAEPMTRDYPGCGPSVDIGAVEVAGHDVQHMLTKAESADIEDACWAYLEEISEREESARLDYLDGVAADRRLERHLEKNREDYRMMASEIARGEYE